MHQPAKTEGSGEERSDNQEERTQREERKGAEEEKDQELERGTTKEERPRDMEQVRQPRKKINETLKVAVTGIQLIRFAEGDRD